ncbi:hypothetical protein CARN8_7010005 [mine drainage metagenome]|uniref:Uncharacterized protein n=1 Tax=mine drainage metagenome TaxID=410659 RepID=A0A3P3ZRE0_9ZZZZ
MGLAVPVNTIKSVEDMKLLTNDG